MDRNMKKTTTYTKNWEDRVLSSTKLTLLILNLSGLVGCKSANKDKTYNDISLNKTTTLSSPLFLPEAERHLLKEIKSRKLAMLSGISYTAEDPSYLIIDGQFDFEFGNLNQVFVLRKNKAADPWGTAEVYWLKSRKLAYIDHDGKKVERTLMYPSELIALPESVRTNLLETIENPPPWLRPRHPKGASRHPSANQTQ